MAVSLKFNVGNKEPVEAALLITLTLEHAGLIGSGAHESLVEKLKSEGLYNSYGTDVVQEVSSPSPQKDSMQTAIDTAKQQGVMTIAEMHEKAPDLTIDNAKPKQRSSITLA